MNIPQYETQFQNLLDLIKQNIPLALAILAGFWVIFLIDALLHYRLNYLGILPRTLPGLVGIIFYTFLHGNFNHLFFNSLPLFVLTTFMLLFGLEHFIVVSISIIVISGLLTWLFGRRAIHIGASSLVLGYWSYLLATAYFQPSILTIPVAVICVYYFGGLALNLFPSEEKVSWEGHVFGFLAGILSYYLFL
jgi:membrane associated rhomboid family serine protease